MQLQGGNKMSNELKLVNTTLEKKNFFDENSKMILESATELENIIITVEKSFNNIQIDFKYDSTKSKFVMVNVYEEKSVQRSAEWAAQYGAEQAIVLDSTFEVRSKDAWATGLEWGKTYRGWSWILVRNENGPWQLKTWGYG